MVKFLVRPAHTKRRAAAQLPNSWHFVEVMMATTGDRNHCPQCCLPFARSANKQKLQYSGVLCAIPSVLQVLGPPWLRLKCHKD